MVKLTEGLNVYEKNPREIKGRKNPVEKSPISPIQEAKDKLLILLTILAKNLNVKPRLSVKIGSVLLRITVFLAKIQTKVDASN